MQQFTVCACFPPRPHRLTQRETRSRSAILRRSGPFGAEAGEEPVSGGLSALEIGQRCRLRPAPTAEQRERCGALWLLGEVGCPEVPSCSPG